MGSVCFYFTYNCLCEPDTFSLSFRPAVKIFKRNNSKPQKSSCNTGNSCCCTQRKYTYSNETKRSCGNCCSTCAYHKFRTGDRCIGLGFSIAKCFKHIGILNSRRNAIEPLFLNFATE